MEKEERTAVPSAFFREKGESLERKALTERFRWEIEQTAPPSEDSLKAFCKAQGMYVLNVPLSTAGGKTAWNTLAQWWGWRVQEHKLTGHIRILDPGNVRQAWGPAEQVLPALLAHIRERDRREAFRKLPRWGIVFCGGGAKGAYQIGVWKRLRELGLEDRLKGVSGASVGALNSLLFAQGDLEPAEKVWLSIRQEDMMRPGPALKTFLETAGVTAGTKAAASALAGLPGHWIARGLDIAAAARLGAPYYLAGSVLTAAAMAYALNRWSTSAGLFSREFLEDIMESRISSEKIGKTDKLVYSALTALSFPHQPGEDGDLRSVFLNAEYHCWQNLSFPEIKERVLASAALPAAYAPLRLDGKIYVDGGVIDNFPVRPLAEAGFSTILVVHLSNPIEVRKRENAWEKTENARGASHVIHIFPSKPVGETLKISPELTLKRMRLGYEDAGAQLKKYV